MPLQCLLGILLFCTTADLHAQYRLYSCGRLRSKDLGSKIRSAYIMAENKQGEVVFKAHEDSNNESWFIEMSTCPITNEAAVAGYMRSSLTLSGTTIKGFINRKNAVVARFSPSGEVISSYAFKTLRTSYFHRVAMSPTTMYASGYARGHRRDKTGIKIPYNKNTAILVSVNRQSELNWCLNDPDACYGASVVTDNTGEYLYWQGCSRVESSNSYYTWLKKINANTGEILWEIKDTDHYFIFDRSHHSEMSMRLDFRDNITVTQLNAVPFRNLVTGEVYYEKHLEVVNYDADTRQEIYRTTVASADGLANSWTASNAINLWDSYNFIDGSLHIVGTLKGGSLRVHQNDSTTYTERARTGVDAFHFKLNYKGELEYANWYAGNGATFINSIGYDGNSVIISGCQYRGITIGDSTYIGYSDKAQIFSAKVDDQPQQRLVLAEEESYEDGEILTDLVVYPNPVSEGGSIRFLNRLRAGIDYDLKIIPIDQTSYEATNIASFKLTQHDVANGSMYIPLGDDFEQGIYYLMLYSEGKLESTTRLVIE